MLRPEVLLQLVECIMWRLWTEMLDPSLLLAFRLVSILSHASTSTIVATTNPMPPRPSDDAIRGEPDNEHLRIQIADYC